MNEQELNKIKAEAVKTFIRSLIDAFSYGFLQINNPNLAELHRAAENYCEMNYNIRGASLVEEWGQNTAELCGIGEDGESQTGDWVRATEHLPDDGVEVILFDNGVVQNTTFFIEISGDGERCWRSKHKDIEDLILPVSDKQQWCYFSGIAGPKVEG